MTTDPDDADSTMAMKRGRAFYCASPHYHPIADAAGFGDEARKVYDIWQARDFKGAAAAVSDDFVQPTIDALCEGARTDEVGDGKIFVVPLERAVRIRTGETDHGAVTPVGG